MPTQADVAKEKELQNSFFKARSSVARFTGWADASYKGIGPHGFNVWEGNPNCQVERDGKIVKGIIHDIVCIIRTCTEIYR